MDLIGTAENPIPSGAQAGFFEAADGARLRHASWAPTGGGRRGTVCLFSGRREFIEKYFETIAELRRRGFHVITMDWRGQGLSTRETGDRRNGHIDHFDRYVDDIQTFLDTLVLPDCPPPFFALAHSMGGTILLHYAAARRPVWFDRMVLTAPMLQLPVRPVPTVLLRGFVRLVCALGLKKLSVPGSREVRYEESGFEDNVLTSDHARFMRVAAVLQAAPELDLGPPSFGWVRAAYAAMAALRKRGTINRIEIPVLLMAAGRDRVVSRRAVEAMGRRLPAGGSVTLDGARHDILNECDDVREQFWAAFDAFIPGSGHGGA